MLIKYIRIRRDLIGTHWFFLSLFLEYDFSFNFWIGIPTRGYIFINNHSSLILALSIVKLTNIIAVIVFVYCPSLAEFSCGKRLWNSKTIIINIIVMVIKPPLKLTSLQFESPHHVLAKIAKLLLIAL